MKRRLYAIAVFILLGFSVSAQNEWLSSSRISIDDICCIRHFYWTVIKKGEKILLRFDDVSRPFIMYVNRKLVGAHGGGYGLFSLDITDKIKQGDNEVIIVGEGNSDTWEKTRIETAPSPRR